MIFQGRAAKLQGCSLEDSRMPQNRQEVAAPFTSTSSLENMFFQKGSGSESTVELFKKWRIPGGSK